MRDNQEVPSIRIIDAEYDPRTGLQVLLDGRGFPLMKNSQPVFLVFPLLDVGEPANSKGQPFIPKITGEYFVPSAFFGGNPPTFDQYTLPNEFDTESQLHSAMKRTACEKN